jgi:hypothetical protein
MFGNGASSLAKRAPPGPKRTTPASPHVVPWHPTTHAQSQEIDNIFRRESTQEHTTPTHTQAWHFTAWLDIIFLHDDTSAASSLPAGPEDATHEQVDIDTDAAAAYSNVSVDPYAHVPATAVHISQQ